MGAESTPRDMTDFDNTKQNVRDRNEDALTPFKQGNNAADLNTTTQIRKEIMSHDNLSLNAKNIKVITVNGRVTLRGPVNSEEEKRILNEIATKVAGSQKVDNQLDLKLNK